MRDSYEGYVIYLFLALMIAYLGGGSDEKVVQVRVVPMTVDTCSLILIHSPPSSTLS